MKRFLKSPLIIIVIMMVLLNVVNGEFSNMSEWIMNKLIMLPGIVIGISFHEYAHGKVSSMLGDPTPEMQGRLTINPGAHLDPFGFVALLFAGFGWGVPVEIDPRYYKHRRSGEFLVAIAGVTMNFIIAVVFSFVLKFIFMSNPGWLYDSMGQVVIDMITSVISINIVLMVFNLLPVPPLDGFGIATELFNLRKYSWYYKIYDKGFIILLFLILFNVTGFILSPAVNHIYSFLINAIVL